MQHKTIFLTCLLSLSLILFIFSCSGEKTDQTADKYSSEANTITPESRIDLWNGKDFSGWKLFVPDTVTDVSTVWIAKNGIVHCTGVPNGYMRTKNDYTNYKLTVEWRWSGEPGNSGVLLHMSEPDKVWPKSIEAQLKSENAGDFWLIDGSEIKEHTDKSSRRVAKREESSEKTPGEWNKYEIFCKGNTIQLYVNGVLQNEGTEASVQSGKICFQSEGKPIQFRSIFLEPVN